MKMACFAITLVVALGACGETVNIDKEACERLQKGPADMLQAAAEAAAAPAMRGEARRHDVELVDIGGSKGGFVMFTAPAASDYAFFFSVDLPVRFLWGARELVPELMGKSGRCPEVKGRVVVPMASGPHLLSFGPTSQTTVGVSVQEDTRGRAHGH